jgi:hypothetical protein
MASLGWSRTDIPFFFSNQSERGTRKTKVGRTDWPKTHIEEISSRIQTSTTVRTSNPYTIDLKDQDNECTAMENDFEPARSDPAEWQFLGSFDVHVEPCQAMDQIEEHVHICHEEKRKEDLLLDIAAWETTMKNWLRQKAHSADWSKWQTQSKGMSIPSL